MALTGQTTLQITRTLNAEGVATQEGKRWLKTTVYRILSNEAYIGHHGLGRRQPRTMHLPCAWKTPFRPSSPIRSSNG